MRLHDLRDNPVNPHRGSYHLVGVEVATELLGGAAAFECLEALEGQRNRVDKGRILVTPFQEAPR